jgi:hypothetical protein
MKDQLSSTMSSSRPSSEFTVVGEDETEEGGGKERRLIREVSEDEGGGTGIGEGERGFGSWEVSTSQSRSSIVMER